MTATDANNPPSGASSAGGQARARLENLPSGPRMTSEQAEARSQMVRRLRIALPVGAALLIAIFFANAGRDRPGDVLLDEFKDVNATADDLRMESPDFSGIDAKGRPYNITADAAIQKPGGEKTVDLERPRARTSSTSENSVVTADRGVFQSDDNILILNDNVTFEHSIGGDDYVLVTPEATVAIDEETVVSDKGVEGRGPGGSALSADRMRANNDAGRVIFEGNVRMRIYPSQAPSLTDPALDDASIKEPAEGDEQ